MFSPSEFWVFIRLHYESWEGRKPRGDTAPFLLSIQPLLLSWILTFPSSLKMPQEYKHHYFRINNNIINNIFSSFVSVLGIESRKLLLPGKGYYKWAACPDLALSQRLTNRFTGPGIKVSFCKYQCSSCTDRAGERQEQGQCWKASCKARYIVKSALKALI